MGILRKRKKMKLIPGWDGYMKVATLGAEDLMRQITQNLETQVWNATFIEVSYVNDIDNELRQAMR